MRPAPHPNRSRALAALALTGLLAAGSLLAACGGPNPTPTPERAAHTDAAGSFGPTVVASPTAGSTDAPSASPSSAPTPTPGPHLDAQSAAALQKTLDTIRTKAGYPGVAAAIVFPDGSTWTGTAGYAVLASKTPVTADTVFSIGSISKTFIAALLLRLSERGKLRLTDRLSQYVPSFPNGGAITLRQLMNHTSGIRDLFNSPGVSDAVLAAPHRIWQPADVLARIGKPYFAPGTGYHYSNTNYLLLGLVVEKVTGKSLGAALRDEFLTPLGLDETFFQTDQRPVGALAHGYRGTAAQPRDVSVGATMLPFESEVTAAGGSGEGASSVKDVARWTTALYAGEVLDPPALAAMTDVSATTPFHPSYPYGLGFEQATLAGHVAWGHRGHLDGFWASMDYLPDVQLTVVVLTNAHWAQPLTPSAQLVSVALASATPSPAPSGAPSSPAPEAPSSAASAAPSPTPAG